MLGARAAAQRLLLQVTTFRFGCLVDYIVKYEYPSVITLAAMVASRLYSAELHMALCPES